MEKPSVAPRTPGLLLCVLALAACGDSPPPGSTYYDRTIQPIFDASCVAGVAGCHAINDGDPFAFAAGNLDLSSYDSVQKRRDVLRTFGAYPVPLLLIKAVGATCELQIPYRDEFLCIDTPHAGGSVLSVGSPAYLTLQTWMSNGATERGLPPIAPPAQGEGDCSNTLPPDFDPTGAVGDPAFATFEADVMPVLRGCSSGTCHGAPQADFHIACGDSDAELAFNFEQARAFVDDAVDNSELLLRPLAVDRGGYAHTGGDRFGSRDDDEYAALRAWAEQVGPTEFGVGDPGQTFFAERIQPLLLSRGCSFEACHSPAAFNDLKLRSGSRGFFSAIALRRNYELLKHDFMAMEFADARNGRAVAKNIFPQDGGIAHRGGPLLETAGGGAARPSRCPQPYAPATASAFCSFQRWVDIEREQLVAAGEATPMAPGDVVPIVYVDRDATHMASPLEFDTYQPGSDILRADATLGVDGAIASVGAPSSLLDGCPGSRAVRDASAPEVSIDGVTVAFSLRLAADQPREIYTVGIDGAGCRRITPAGFPAVESGVLVHNFDPVWSRDGQHIVFASSRAGTVSRKLLLPQSDIWRMRPDGSAPEQVTVLTNSEISPAFMREGRIIMTTEKVSQGFYQLSGRRINWDLTDYHPLLAQRSRSPFCAPEDPSITCPSVDYQQATEIRELGSQNFVLVLSDAGVRAGAGTLATFNRSVGPFEAGRSDDGYLRSLRILDPAATGRAGSPTRGAYRSPFGLPDGSIMASYADFGGDLASATSLDFDLVVTRPCVPPAPGVSCSAQRTLLIGGPGQQVEAVLAVRRSPHAGYINRRQLVFGGGAAPALTGGEDHAVVHMIDAPLVFTLLVANLRRGRPVELFRDAAYVAVYVERPAPATISSLPGGADHYEDRVFAGRAALHADGSVKFRAPARTPMVLELQDADGNALVTMSESHQLGPGEVISMGVVAPLFDAVCAGCHGSISGRELDVRVTPDVLTGASQSAALSEPATELQ